VLGMRPYIRPEQGLSQLRPGPVAAPVVGPVPTMGSPNPFGGVSEAPLSPMAPRPAIPAAPAPTSGALPMRADPFSR